MDLKTLTKAGGLVPSDLVKRNVTWDREGEEPLSFDVFIRRLSFGDVERILNEETAGKSRVANLISASVRLGETGGEVLTYDNAYQLDPSLAKVFAAAVSDVNELGKAKPTT